MEAQEIAQNYEGNQEHEDTAPAKRAPAKSLKKSLMDIMKKINCENAELSKTNL